MKPAAFLDRDGTIIVDKHFLSDSKQIELIDGAVEALRLLKEMGFLIIILTNQSGVARGYFDVEKVKEINSSLENLLSESGINIDAIYFCPHHKDGIIKEYSKDCNCRKPKTGMIDSAVKDFAIDFEQSIVIGDKYSDIELAKNAGIQPFLVRTGKGEDVYRKYKDCNDFRTFDSILKAVRYIYEKRSSLR